MHNWWIFDLSFHSCVSKKKKKKVKNMQYYFAVFLIFASWPDRFNFILLSLFWSAIDFVSLFCSVRSCSPTSKNYKQVSTWFGHEQLDVIRSTSIKRLAAIIGNHADVTLDVVIVTKYTILLLWSISLLYLLIFWCLELFFLEYFYRCIIFSNCMFMVSFLYKNIFSAFISQLISK